MARDKYKTKAFLDTAVYRGGDVVNGWLYHGLGGLLARTGLALVALPATTGLKAADLRQLETVLAPMAQTWLANMSQTRG